MVTFGLVLHVSNLNDLENWQAIEEKERVLYRRISLLLVVILSVLLGFAYVADLDKTDLYNKSTITKYSAALALISLIFISSIYIRYKNQEQND
ncbi:hypothetical protein GCM10028825_07740 [Spirosoma agri]|nr:hypothetical protein [Spirosoma agri]